MRDFISKYSEITNFHYKSRKVLRNFLRANEYDPCQIGTRDGIFNLRQNPIKGNDFVTHQSAFVTHLDKRVSSMIFGVFLL